MESSAMERRVHDVLSAEGIPFAEEYTFDDLTTSQGVPLRFDFAVFDDDGSLDFLIEANGRQHYSPVGKYGGMKGLRRQKFNDAHKMRYCQQHGIKLVVIPYWDEGRISYEYIMEAAGY